jgi:hypothetical protein
MQNISNISAQLVINFSFSNTTTMCINLLRKQASLSQVGWHNAVH